MEKKRERQRQRRREEEKVAAIVARAKDQPQTKTDDKKERLKEREHACARIAHHERLVESVEHLSLLSLFLFSLSLTNFFSFGIQKCCLGFQSRAHALFGKAKKRSQKIFKFALSRQTKREREIKR